MKKKIIYISGADIFNVNDVKTAFDEVRAALNLDTDVLLFGVPVDNFETVPDTETVPIADSVANISENTDDVVQDSKNAVESPIIKETPVKKPRKSKKNIAKETLKSEDVPVDVEESITGDSDVPILSVLATNQPDVDDEIEEDAYDTVMETESDTVTDEDVMSTDDCPEEDNLQDDNAPVEYQEYDDEQLNQTDTDEAVQDESSELDDMLNDDMPVEASEKTLEELLESMTPLGEDAHVENTDQMNSNKQDDEIDVTLEHLASEFAETQDKVQTSKKGSERGKIGKLKNILPFKKIKRDDSGIMGDLFGWAGIAANDEDFTIPGFFTSAASKK